MIFKHLWNKDTKKTNALKSLATYSRKLDKPQQSTMEFWTERLLIPKFGSEKI